MRALPVLAALAFLAIGAMWLHATALHRVDFGAGSSLGYGPAGLSQARSYLVDVLHCDVGTLSRPLARGSLPPGAVLLRIEPEFRSFIARSGPSRQAGSGEHGEGGRDGKGIGTPSGKHGDAGGDRDGAQQKPDADSSQDSDHTQGTDGRKDGQGGDAQHGQDGRHDADQHDNETGERGQEGSFAPYRPLLTDAEDSWVAGGGRLVLGLDANNDPLEIDTQSANSAIVKTFPALPGVARLLPPIRRTLGGVGMREAATVFAGGDHPAIARIQRGQGEVWLLACPEILDNGHLRLGDHLQLLSDLCAGRPVRFDEFAHGMAHDVGVRELLMGWRLGPALVLASIAGCLWYWRGRTVLGQAAPPPPPSRAEAIDGIGALGALYTRAMPRGEALDAYHRRYRRMLRARLGLDEAGSAREADRRLPSFRASIERAGADAKSFTAAIARLNAASRRLRDDRSRRRP